MKLGINKDEEYPVYSLRPHTESVDFVIEVDEAMADRIQYVMDEYDRVQRLIDSLSPHPYFDR